jgi:hypothetical protein
MGHASVDLDAEFRNVRELVGVVLAGEDRLGEILPDLLGIDVEGRGKFDVPHVVPAEIHVHEARDLLSGVGILVVLDSLHERARTVAHADDRDPDLVVPGAIAAGAVRPSIHGAHPGKSSSIRRLSSETTLAMLRGYTSSAETASCPGAPSRSAPRSLSSFLTCQTRWTTVKAVSAAIT